VRVRLTASIATLATTAALAAAAVEVSAQPARPRMLPPHPRPDVATRAAGAAVSPALLAAAASSAAGRVSRQDASMSTAPSPPAEAPRTYVLVHGAFQSQWNWDAVRADLERRGATVITPDLPAHGADPTPPARATLDGYRDAVVRAIGDRTNVILVGHSAGGMTISAVAEAVPERIATLVYVAAFLPRDGDALLPLSQDPANAGSDVGKYFVLDTARGVASFKPEGLVDLFCADCDAAHQAAIRAHPQPEPLAPQATPVRLTPERFGRVPKVYVETLRDRNVTHPLQELMLSRTPVQRRVRLDTSHAPMLSMPDRLAAILAGV
jgi:pimeloyl-ACP methyl ester carboxylesterase